MNGCGAMRSLGGVSPEGRVPSTEYRVPSTYCFSVPPGADFGGSVPVVLSFAVGGASPPASTGGWSVLPNILSNLDLMNPVINASLDGSGLRGSVGWADDPTLEGLRDAFAFEMDPRRRQAIATRLQFRSDEQAFSIPLGGNLVVTGHRDTLQGVVADQVLVFWNMGWA